MAVAAEELKEEEVPEEGEEGDDAYKNLGKRKKRVPFENIMRKINPETKGFYQSIVTELRKYKFNDRISIPGETFSFKRERFIFITVVGTTLRVYFRLDPKQFYGSTIPMKDASDVKKYQDIPSFLKIKSNLAVKRTIELAKKLAEENGIAEA